MSPEQDPNEQANISGADLAILVDDLKELRRKLAEQQNSEQPPELLDAYQSLQEDYIKQQAQIIEVVNLILVVDSPSVDAFKLVDDLREWLAVEKNTTTLQAQLSAAKQEGYVQAEQKYLAQHNAAFMIGKQAGRDEVLRELSEQPADGFRSAAKWLIFPNICLVAYCVYKIINS